MFDLRNCRFVRPLLGWSCCGIGKAQRVRARTRLSRCTNDETVPPSTMRLFREAGRC
jgi:hypothetical protein